MKELVRYLFENLYFDFQGDISVDKVRDFLREDDSREARQLLSKIIEEKGVDKVRDFLREDDSREARQLLSKIIEEKGVDDLLITLADVLKDHIRTGVSEQNIRDQLSTYSES